MLCTRCQQREAMGPDPDAERRFQERFATPWPFPTDLCAECLGELAGEDPDFRAKAAAFSKAVRTRIYADVTGALRRAVDKALDLADRIAAKIS